MRKQMRRLSQEEFYKLTQWVAARHESLAEDAPGLAELCRHHYDETQVSVVPGTMAKAIGVTGVKYNPRRIRTVGQVFKEDVERALGNVRDLRDEIISLQEKQAVSAAQQAVAFAMIRELAAALGYTLKADAHNGKTECVQRDLARIDRDKFIRKCQDEGK